jgi:hypothetical protein
LVVGRVALVGVGVACGGVWPSGAYGHLAVGKKVDWSCLD